jgi:hypothetical protein
MGAFTQGVALGCHSALFQSDDRQFTFSVRSRNSFIACMLRLMECS